MHDLPLLLGRDAQLDVGWIAEAFEAKAQHLVRRLAGCADDVDVSEAFFVRAIRAGELAHGLLGCAASSALFLRRPRAALRLADARMCRERLVPILLGQR